MLINDELHARLFTRDFLEHVYSWELLRKRIRSFRLHFYVEYCFFNHAPLFVGMFQIRIESVASMHDKQQQKP